MSGALFLLLLGAMAEATRLRGPGVTNLANVTEDTKLSDSDQAKLVDLEGALGDMKKEAAQQKVEEAKERVGAWTAASSPSLAPEIPVSTPSSLDRLSSHVSDVSATKAADSLGSLDDELHTRLAKSPSGIAQTAEQKAPLEGGESTDADALAARLGESNKLEEDATQMDAFYAHTPSPDTFQKHAVDARESTEDLRDSMSRFVAHDAPKPKRARATESWRDMADRLSMPSLD